LIEVTPPLDTVEPNTDATNIGTGVISKACCPLKLILLR
jgi:hypothetical protein